MKKAPGYIDKILRLMCFEGVRDLAYVLSGAPNVNFGKVYKCHFTKQATESSSNVTRVHLAETNNDRLSGHRLAWGLAIYSCVFKYKEL